MFRILLVLLIVIPALEIWGILLMGNLIGGWPTFLIILLTGLLGAFFAKKEAQKVWGYARNQWAAGKIPTASILDGICIFAGGLLLVTPGFLTDAMGILLVFPGTRAFLKVWLLWWIQKFISTRRINRF